MKHDGGVLRPCVSAFRFQPLRANPPATISAAPWIAAQTVHTG